MFKAEYYFQVKVFLFFLKKIFLKNLYNIKVRLDNIYPP